MKGEEENDDTQDRDRLKLLTAEKELTRRSDELARVAAGTAVGSGR